MLVSIATIFEDAVGDAARKVPATLSHCMLAVRRKGHEPAEAWNICRASLTRQGYLRGPYRRDAKAKASSQQTHKGTMRTMKHGTEKGSHVKFERFRAMFAKIAPKVVDR